MKDFSGVWFRQRQSISKICQKITRKLDKKLVRFAAAREGIAAVEFALIAPILILIFIGCVELSLFASNLRKVGNLARALGEVVSQGETFDERAAHEVFRAATLILPPFDGETAKIKLSTVGKTKKDGSSQVKVCSVASTQNTQPRQIGESMAHIFPDEEDGSRFLYVEVEMPYRIFFVGQILDVEAAGINTIPIRKALKWPVRKGVRKNSRYPEVVLSIGGAC